MEERQIDKEFQVELTIREIKKLNYEDLKNYAIFLFKYTLEIQDLYSKDIKLLQSEIIKLNLEKNKNPLISFIDFTIKILNSIKKYLQSLNYGI